jgi:hypothetical protein
MRHFFLCLPAILFVGVLPAQRNCYHTTQKQLPSAVAGPVHSYRVSTLSGPNDNGVKALEATTIIRIPVVVHILWNKNEENISETQIKAQLALLNKDFSATNNDIELVPAYFRERAANTGIQFVLARKDEAGQPTTGIIRKKTTISGFGFNDQMKNSAAGGSTGWNADYYLNIWVCPLQDGIQGYASMPGSPAFTDGVVIDNNVFGPQLRGPFNKGRTATHEIGHWLGLQHIWGDADCGDDGVEDTPPQQGPTRGCPGGVQASCNSGTNGNMYMNFMDLTDDACMLFFTKGQCFRMREQFEPLGRRNSLLSSRALEGAEMAEAPLPSKAGWALFPVPTIHTLFFQTDAEMGCVGKNYYIVNGTGQLAGSGWIQSTRQEIPITHLRPGLYFIKVEGMSNYPALKFIKQ